MAYGVTNLDPGVIHTFSTETAAVAAGAAAPEPVVKSIAVGEINRLVSAAWTSDGKRLLMASHTSRGSIIWLVEESGKTKQLSLRAWAVQELSLSPDGKKLAISELTTNSNAWMIPKCRRSSRGIACCAGCPLTKTLSRIGFVARGSSCNGLEG